MLVSISSSRAERNLVENNSSGLSNSRKKEIPVGSLADSYTIILSILRVYRASSELIHTRPLTKEKEALSIQQSSCVSEIILQNRIT